MREYSPSSTVVPGNLWIRVAIVHRITSMMKDVNGLSRNIDPLIHRYIVQAYTMRAADTTQRPFAYCHDTFTSCSNPRRVIASDTTAVTKLSSTLPPFPNIHHSSINFISTPILQLVPPPT